MKKFLIYFVILTHIFGQLSLFSCGNRNPNLSRNQLLELAGDTTPKADEKPAFVFPDTGYVPPVGTKYTEIRSVDPASPPITLKVSIPQGTMKPLKLSLFGSKVEYVNNIKIDFKSYKRATLMDISGTRCFLTFVDFEGDVKAYRHLTINFVHPRDTLYDKNGKKKIWAGEFDLAKRPIFTPQSEMTDLTPGVEMSPVRLLPTGMFIDDNTRFKFWLVGNPIGVSFNNMGDTLCKFTNYVESSGAYVSDRPFSYRTDGMLFFRQEHNDTIFRVQSANRIVPAYRFDFGDKRLTPSEGATNKTQGKLIPWNWLVFKNSMLLIFSEGRDCPICRTRNEVTFHCLLFDKQTGQPTAIDMRSRYPDNILIENDIDGGLPIPLNSLHTQDGGILATYTKGQMEEILKNNSGNIPPETASKLKTMAESMKQNEMLVMTVE